MRVLLRGVLFHIMSLAIFTYIYFILYETDFENVIEGSHGELSTDKKLMDCFYFTTTIEAGVGLTSLQPTTNLSKFIVCIQQIFMIIANIVILYFSFIQPKKLVNTVKKFIRP
jgi:hypothetical protein